LKPHGIQEVVGSIPISSTNLGINIAGGSGLLVGTANPSPLAFFVSNSTPLEKATVECWESSIPEARVTL